MPRLKSNTHRWIIVIGMVIAGIVAVVSPYVITDTIQGRVTGKQGQAGAGNYIIFVRKPNGTMESLGNKDTYLRFKFNSTDIQGSAEVGKTYNFQVLGYRSHFWSAYRNIVDLEEVAQ